MNYYSHTLFIISVALTSIMFFLFVELNKNRIIGWVIGVAIIAAYVYLYYTNIGDRPLPMRFASYIAFTAILVGVTMTTQGPYRLVPAVDSDNPEKTEVISLAQGKLTGVKTKDGKVEVYAGIPYAKPPVGDLRWKEPQDPSPWKGILKADHFAPMSMQESNGEFVESVTRLIGYHDYKVTTKDNYRHKMSEDSLYLNIWKPSGKLNKAPVVVYLHGGYLRTGQPWYADYSGEGFAKDGVIVVNMGYRLGAFGYFADSELAAESPNGTTGNYGLLDQIKALEWVQKNIYKFGGDPNNVTLAGESAGSASVTALTASPLAKGLFRRVIAESSTVTTINPPHSFRTMSDALKAGKETKKKLGAKSMEDLRKIPADKIVEQASHHHHMTVDGYVLTESPYEAYVNGHQHTESILHGYNSNEGGAFLVTNPAKQSTIKKRIRSEVPNKNIADLYLQAFPTNSDKASKKSFEDFYTTYYFGYSHYRWSKQAADNGIPTYEYFFTKNNGRLGAWHSGEEVYLYGNIPTGKMAGAKLYDKSDMELQRIFHSYALNFIKYGNPNGKRIDGKDLPEWPKAEDGLRPMELGKHVGIIDDPFLRLYRELDKLEN